MAFNLNKNEPTGNSTKFNLSKTDAASTADRQQEKRSPKNLVLALAGLLVVAIAAWYFLSGSTKTNSGNDKSNTAATATEPVAANDTSGSQLQSTATVPDTTKQTQPGNMVTPGVATTTGVKTVADNNNSSNNTDRTTAAGFMNTVPATFAKGSAAISQLDQSLVKDLLTFLKKNNSASIYINGFASSEGALQVNQQISQARAEAFKRYLVSKGIPGDRINTTGKGIDHPIASNETEEGRIRNRRIEIVIQ